MTAGRSVRLGRALVDRLLAVRETSGVEVELIEEVRKASDLTMDLVTARVIWSAKGRVRGLSMIADILRPDHFSPPVGRTARSAWLTAGGAVRAADHGLSKLVSTDELGVVDFLTGGCFVSGRKLGLAYETYLRPGLVISRLRPIGSWKETLGQPAQGSSVYTPIWLVELLRGVTEAAVSEPETVDGAPCRHLSARCDPSRAAQRSRHGMELPDFLGSSEFDAPGLLIDQRSVPTELWIDSSGYLRRVRASFQIGAPDEIIKETTGFSAGLVLRDLGTAPALIPPPGAAVRVEACAVNRTSRWSPRAPSTAA